MTTDATALQRAQYVRDQLPVQGLFAGATWRISPEAFPISQELLEKLINYQNYRDAKASELREGQKFRVEVTGEPPALLGVRTR